MDVVLYHNLDLSPLGLPDETLIESLGETLLSFRDETLLESIMRDFS